MSKRRRRRQVKRLSLSPEELQAAFERANENSKSWVVWHDTLSATEPPAHYGYAGQRPEPRGGTDD